MFINSIQRNFQNINKKVTGYFFWEKYWHSTNDIVLSNYKATGYFTGYTRA